MNLPQKFIEDTYTVEFYHGPNNFTVCVDVLSTDDHRAETFARNRFKLDSSWELVGVDKKYGPVAQSG